MKAFLTGATGFIGQSLVSRLLGDLWSIKALVRHSSNILPDIVESVTGDLLVLDDGFSECLRDIDVVIHLAARVHVMRDTHHDPLNEYRATNRDATLNLARLAANAGVKRFIYISSIKVNGEINEPNGIFKPDDSFIPDDPYGLSKYEAEQGLISLAREKGMEVVIIRPPLVYGIGVKGNFAMLSKWVKRGIPLPLGALENRRSFLALENLVDFITLCADRTRSPKAANQIFLLSDGEVMSTTQMLRKLASAQGVDARLLPIPAAFLSFVATILGKRSVADRLLGSLQVDDSKSRELLGWRPIVTMDQQLAHMFRENGQ